MRVPQDAIAQDLGVSRIPVREALIVLEREGWVTNEMHRGAFINALDEQTVHDHYELFGLIYGFAAKRALARAGDDLPQQLGRNPDAVRAGHHGGRALRPVHRVPQPDRQGRGVTPHQRGAAGHVGAGARQFLRGSARRGGRGEARAGRHHPGDEAGGRGQGIRRVRQDDAATWATRWRSSSGSALCSSRRTSRPDGREVERLSATCPRTLFAASPSPVSTTRCRRASSPSTIRPRSPWPGRSARSPMPGSPRTRSTASSARTAAHIALELGLGPCTRRPSSLGIPTVLDAAALITTGQCEVVLIAAGGAGIHVDRELDRTLDPAGQRARRRLRPVHGGRVRPHGAPSHAHLRHHARTAGRRRGHHPHERTRATPMPSTTAGGPFSPADILASRMIADPFHLLDCAMTSEGGCGIVLVAAERAAECAAPRLDPRRGQ